MAPEAASAQASVVLASFESRRAAEHMLASLRRGLRTKARKGHVTALVVSANKDGSVKLTQSRLLTASGFVYTLLRISIAIALGFLAYSRPRKALKAASTRHTPASHTSGQTMSEFTNSSPMRGRTEPSCSCCATTRTHAR